MRGSHAKSEPQALTDWLAQESADWQPQFPFPGDIRRPVVDALSEAQRGLCVYCGRKLDLSAPGKSYHIEHFRPISTYPDHEVSLANLFLSCGQETETGNRSETCGTAKANWFDEIPHVEPDYPACTDRFRFTLTGHVRHDRKILATSTGYRRPLNECVATPDQDSTAAPGRLALAAKGLALCGPGRTRTYDQGIMSPLL